MKEKENRESGIITVFVSLLLVPLLSFGTLIMECGRYVSAKQALADAMVTASMSVLADYNTYIYERFGLVTIDPDSSTESHFADFGDILRYNADNEDGVKSLSKMYVVDSDIEFATVYSLDDFQVIKRQVLEYAKYSIPYRVISDALDIEGIFGKLKEKILNSNVVTSFLESLSNVTKDALDAMDEALDEMGESERLLFGAINYFGGSKSKNDYKNKDLKDDTKAPDTYNDRNNYNGRYNTWKNALKAKSDYMATHPNPSKTYNTVNTGGRNLVGSDPLTDSTATQYKYYLAIIKYLENTSNAEAGINALTSQTITLTQQNYDSSYNLNEGIASITPAGSQQKSYKINITNAVHSIDPNASVTTYEELQDFADAHGLKKSDREYYQSRLNSDISYNSKVSEYNELKQELANKVTQYNKDISNLNSDINSAKSEYLSALSKAKSLLEGYRNQLEKTDSKLNDARDNLDNLVQKNKEGYQQAGGTSGEFDQKSKNNSDSIKQKIQDVKTEISSAKQKVSTAIGYIDTCVGVVNGISAESITSVNIDQGGHTVLPDGRRLAIAPSTLTSYLPTAIVTKIGILCDAQAVDDDSSIGSAIDNNNPDAVSDDLGIGDMYEAFKKLKDKINLVPSIYSDEYVMELDQETISLLPKVSSTGQSNAEDEQLANDLMAELGRRIGSYTLSDYNVDGSDSDTNDVVNKAENASGKISGDEDDADLYAKSDDIKSLGLFKLIKKIKELIDQIKAVFQAIKDMISSIATLVSGFVESTYYTVLINTYITQKFPSRMSTVETAETEEHGKTSGASGASYFSSCCVEYCLFGKTKEKDNQKSAFWIIFALRALMNCIQIAMDKTLMQLVSSCSYFAPLVFIALLYIETNIDLNFLVRLGEKIPIWKQHLHLSTEGLKSLLSDIIDFDSTYVYIAKSGNGYAYHNENCPRINGSNSSGRVPITKSQAIRDGKTPCKVCKPNDSAESESESEEDSDGYVPLSYDNYLYIMLFFMSNETKMERLGRLVQLETRFHENKSGTATFLLKNTGTYVRSKVGARYNTILPMISLGTETHSFPRISNVEYVGY